MILLLLRYLNLKTKLTTINCLDTCDDEPLLSYVGKASVEMLGMPDPEKWSKLGGSTPT